MTVTAAPGASVDMSLDFNGASNITVAGMTIGTATIEGASHDITVSGSTFPPPGGAITVHPDQMNASSNIVIDRDTFNGQLCDQMSAQGRVAVEAIGNNNGNPLGLTISNNLFEGGTADGIRPDSGSGIQILNNQFISFDNSLNETCHTDAIQLYGSATHILFKGNFFYNSIDMAGCSFSEWNGGDFNTFEDNVVAGTPNNGCYDAIDLHSDNGSTIIHNTFAFGGCLPARNSHAMRQRRPSRRRRARHGDPRQRHDRLLDHRKPQPTATITTSVTTPAAGVPATGPGLLRSSEARLRPRSPGSRLRPGARVWARPPTEPTSASNYQRAADGSPTSPHTADRIENQRSSGRKPPSKLAATARFIRRWEARCLRSCRRMPRRPRPSRAQEQIRRKWLVQSHRRMLACRCCRPNRCIRNRDRDCDRR